MRSGRSRSQALRRSVPIRAYVGPNGGGKSLLMVHDVLPSLAAGRPVLSTVKILDARTGLPHPLYTPLTRFQQLLEAEKCDVLLDEVTGVASSRSASAMPIALANQLTQLRRKDITVSWTSPSWARADVIIREVTQAVTVCRGLLPKVEGDRLWPARRLFLSYTYDSQMFDEWTAGKAERLKPVTRDRMWRPGGLAERSYSTLDPVTMLEHISEHGTCLNCGGNRPKPKCQCEPSAVSAAGLERSAATDVASTAEPAPLPTAVSPAPWTSLGPLPVGADA